MQTHVLTTLLFLGVVTATGALFSDAATDAERVQIPVLGLDAESAPAIERALRALESEVGPPHVKVLAEVAVDAQRGWLALEIAPGGTLRLEQVERCLNATFARVQRDKLALGEARLLFEGAAPDDAPEKLQRALTGDLFAQAQVRFEGEPRRLVADVRPGEMPATLDAAERAAQRVAPGLKLADAIWSRPRAR